MSAVFEQLKSACLPLMQAFENDLLTHDRNWIDRYPGIPFVHWTRPTGTWLSEMWPSNHPVFPPKGQKVPYLFGTADREHILKGQVSVADYCLHYKEREGTAMACHYFDGKTLRMIDLKKAKDILESYARQVRMDWERRVLAVSA